MLPAFVALLAAAAAAALLTGPLVHRRPPPSGGPGARPPRARPGAPADLYQVRRGWRAAVRAWRRRRDVEAGLEALALVCVTTAAELRAGRRREEALQVAVAWTHGPLPAAVTQAAQAGVMGADVAAVLRVPDSTGSGDQLTTALRALAACWEATGDTGAGLALALDRLGAALRASVTHRREVGAQLAGSRATMRILALLPAVGLGLGAMLGADPVGFLLGSVMGRAALVGGLVLQAAGVGWTRRLVRAAQG
jgi:tight adherence protein B